MKPTKSPHSELSGLARAINAREGHLILLEKQCHEGVANFLDEAILQGVDLLSAKARLKHGDWQDWLAANCPTIHIRKAQKYMLVASKTTRGSFLKGAESLRQALELCRVEDAGGDPNKTPKQWPAYMEAIGRLSKFRGFLKDHPLEKMPAEGIEKIRGDLEPIARQLWPEKFSGESPGKAR